MHHVATNIKQTEVKMQVVDFEIKNVLKTLEALEHEVIRNVKDLKDDDIIRRERSFIKFSQITNCLRTSKKCYRSSLGVMKEEAGQLTLLRGMKQ